MALTQVQGGMILPSTTLTTPIVSTTMGVGGATPAASGSGITFPATQSASTNANTLDDYEEGSWTPGVVNVTFVADGAQSGRYIKIGRVVTIFWDLIGNWSSSNGSNARISGLPFVPDTDISKGGYSTAQFRDSSALPSGTLVGWFDAGASNIYIESNQRGAAAAWQNGTALRTTGMAVYLATS